MKGAAKMFFAELAITAIGTVFIAVFYIFATPPFRTYSALILSLVAVAFASGYVARKLLVNNRRVGWVIVVIISIAVTLLTLNLALFWIVNVRGS
jgi:hypothetical protein